jgi:DnaK suppressor protein
MTTENYREALLALKETLLKAQETGDQAEQTVELDQSRVGRLSRMDAMQAQAMSKETGRRRRQQLLQIEAALKRIEEDDYGYCQECGENIAPARLEVDPTALLCISCASAKEL